MAFTIDAIFQYLIYRKILNKFKYIDVIVI